MAAGEEGSRNEEMRQRAAFNDKETHTCQSWEPIYFTVSGNAHALLSSLRDDSGIVFIVCHCSRCGAKSALHLRWNIVFLRVWEKNECKWNESDAREPNKCNHFFCHENNNIFNLDEKGKVCLRCPYLASENAKTTHSSLCFSNEKLYFLHGQQMNFEIEIRWRLRGLRLANKFSNFFNPRFTRMLLINAITTKLWLQSISQRWSTLTHQPPSKPRTSKAPERMQPQMDELNCYTRAALAHSNVLLFSNTCPPTKQDLLSIGCHNDSPFGRIASPPSHPWHMSSERILCAFELRRNNGQNFSIYIRVMRACAINSHSLWHFHLEIKTVRFVCVIVGLLQLRLSKFRNYSSLIVCPDCVPHFRCAVAS